jgi:hypothetical protein
MEWISYSMRPAEFFGYWELRKKTEFHPIVLVPNYYGVMINFEDSLSIS